MPRSMTTNTYRVRNVAVTTTKKSHAAITCLGVVADESEPSLLGLARASRSTDAQVLSDSPWRYANAQLQFQSFPMRSSPQVAFAAAISRIS